MHGTERVEVCLSKALYSETNSQKLTEAKVFADRKTFPSAVSAIVAISAASCSGSRHLLNRLMKYVNMQIHREEGAGDALTH